MGFYSDLESLVDKIQTPLEVVDVLVDLLTKEEQEEPLLRARTYVHTLRRAGVEGKMGENTLGALLALRDLILNEELADGVVLEAPSPALIYEVRAGPRGGGGGGRCREAGGRRACLRAQPSS